MRFKKRQARLKRRPERGWKRDWNEAEKEPKPVGLKKTYRVEKKLTGLKKRLMRLKKRAAPACCTLSSCKRGSWDFPRSHGGVSFQHMKIRIITSQTSPPVHPIHMECKDPKLFQREYLLCNYVQVYKSWHVKKVLPLTCPNHPKRMPIHLYRPHLGSNQAVLELTLRMPRRWSRAARGFRPENPPAQGERTRHPRQRDVVRPQMRSLVKHHQKCKVQCFKRRVAKFS